MKLYQGETLTDYSNCCIYKIYCLDPEIKDIYVGSTTNFRARYMQHRASCINNSNQKSNLKLVYNFMRENGGHENWEMEIIEKFSCKSKTELLWKERQWYDKLKPKLNIKKPVETREEYNERKRLAWVRSAPEKKRIKLEKHREWYQKNREEILLQIKIKKEKAKEREKERERERHKKRYVEDEENRKKILEERKKFYQENKDKIRKKQKEKFECECGGRFTTSSKARHQRTKKHQEYLSTIEHE